MRDVNCRKSYKKRSRQKAEGAKPPGEGTRRRMEFMAKKVFSHGAVHTVPADLRKALLSDSENGKTLRRSPAMNGSAGYFPARKRIQENSTSSGYARNLGEGSCRPCCWPGCPHR